MKTSLLTFALLILSFSALQGKTVFKAGEDGYRIYRIPAVVKASNGHLLAFCEARQGGDASEIDLVVKEVFENGKPPRMRHAPGASWFGHYLAYGVNAPYTP